MRAACIAEIHNGPWKFIQLRGGLIDHSRIDGDDIDLLCSEKSVNALLSHTYQWVQNGDCHIRVVSRRPDQAERDGKKFIRSADEKVGGVKSDQVWIDVGSQN